VISLTCLVLGAFALVACNDDGRTLRPARPDQNASISTTSSPTTVTPELIGDGSPSSEVDGITPSTTASDGGSALGSIVPTSTVAVGSVVAPSTVLAPWREGAAIDARYTCSGVDVSPPLSWSPAPAGTAEIAITMTDAQAPTFVHWVIAGLGSDATTIDEGEAPVGVVQAVNGAGGTGYTGPCPPQGETHTYRITVHFLDSQTELGDGADAEDLLAVIDAATITEASVTGTFSRV
jgi:hypothetical protein